MGERVSQLAKMTREGAKAAEVVAHLDGLDDDARVAELYGLGLSEQKTLWALSEQNAPLSMDDFAPVMDQKLIYRGRNSLVAFQRFEKHFWRSSGDGECFGFNQNPGLVTWFAGPGYFSFFAEDGRIVFDYTKVPTRQLPDWPKIQINERGFGPRVVYGHMQDYNRRLSARVVIGHAHKKGKPIPAYYVITRVDR